MEETWLRVGQAVHGHLGWLAVAALVHPALLLRRPGAVPRWAVLAAVGLTTLVVAGGAALYPTYRTEVRPGLFALSPAAGWWFERKEGLAVLVLSLAWTGGVAAWLVGRPLDGRTSLRRTAALAFTLAAVGAGVCATAGTAVAVLARF